MKSLVIGYGSIGSRHARIMTELGIPTSVLSSRTIKFKPAFQQLEKAIKNDYDYVVVANKTSEHYGFLCQLEKAGYQGTVLVEKPIFINEERKKFSFERILVAYNLRFHPLLLRLKKLLEGEKVISVHCYIGKYLPQWRPEADYRQGYSASKTAGGGVLRDLSHELDYLNWILGGWTRVTAIGGHFSHLKIDSDDMFSLMIAMRNCPAVLVQMNYLDGVSRREMIINTDGRTFKADLIGGVLEIDEKKEIFKVERDDTYKAEHLAIIEGDYDKLCSHEEGLDVMRLIIAAEKASAQSVWVRRYEKAKS